MVLFDFADHAISFGHTNQLTLESTTRSACCQTAGRAGDRHLWAPLPGSSRGSETLSPRIQVLAQPQAPKLSAESPHFSRSHPV